MRGLLRLLLFLLLLATIVAAVQKKPVPGKLRDQSKFACYTSNYRLVVAECSTKQTVCYYTRRTPRFASDFRPDDLLGRGCDVPRNEYPDSCQIYTKGLDAYVRCECGSDSCNTHYWHGFATTAMHHRQLLATRADPNHPITPASHISPAATALLATKYSDWFMTCFNLYALLQVYYLVVFAHKWCRFQKRAVRVRAVLVARGIQQAELLQWNSDEHDVTIHNFRTSVIKVIDGFIRYRSLGALPPIDIHQMRATWLLGRQDMYRVPEWFRRAMKKEQLVKLAAKYFNEGLDVARVGIEAYAVDELLENEMDEAELEKEEDAKLEEVAAISEVKEEKSTRKKAAPPAAPKGEEAAPASSSSSRAHALNFERGNFVI